MRARIYKAENQILEQLEEMSYIAKSAKRIEEITEVMTNIALQTSLMALDSAIAQRELTRVGNTVSDATEEMYIQFNLLLEEVSSLNKYVEANRRNILKEKELN